MAVPFALAAQGLAASGEPWRHPARIASVAAGAVSVVGRLIYLRLPAPLLGTSGLSVWSLLFGTAAASVWLESRLFRIPPCTVVNKREHAEAQCLPG